LLVLGLFLKAVLKEESVYFWPCFEAAWAAQRWCRECRWALFGDRL